MAGRGGAEEGGCLAEDEVGLGWEADAVGEMEDGMIKVPAACAKIQ